MHLLTSVNDAEISEILYTHDGCGYKLLLLRVVHAVDGKSRCSAYISTKNHTFDNGNSANRAAVRHAVLSSVCGLDTSDPVLRMNVRNQRSMGRDAVHTLAGVYNHPYSQIMFSPT